MKALNDVLVDGRFKLPSAVTSTARVSAVKSLEWASKDENKAMLQSFAEETTYCPLHTAFDSRMKWPHRQREKTWGNYHKIHTSSFLSPWSSFITLAVGGPAIPQHLTMLMFREIIHQQFPLEKETSTNKTFLLFRVKRKMLFTMLLGMSAKTCGRS